MLQIQFIRENKSEVQARLKKRMLPDEQLALVDRVLEVDEKRRHTQQQLDEARAEMNKGSKLIGQLFGQGKKDEAENKKQQVSGLKDQIKELESQFQSLEGEMEEILLNIPNVPHESVPAGKSEDDNEVYRPWTDTLPRLGEYAVPHWELAKRMGLIDFELGAKITGAGFPLFRGAGARLERALINFFLDEARDAGYEEIQPPLLVNEATARATGQLPDKEGQMYYVEKDDLYLIPTAEVPITNILRDEIIDAVDQLPIKYCGYTPCFRREAGAYGKEVRGLNRVHQFDKVEIVQVAHPEHSYEILNEMLTHVSSLLDKLELPYRILRLCGGDLGFTAALTYDFEVYSAAQGRWLEVSSVSNFETYQSNRLKLRYRDANGKPQLAHTLNGSALALARIVAALLENNQTPDGVVIPKVLHSYTGFEKIK